MIAEASNHEACPVRFRRGLDTSSSASAGQTCLGHTCTNRCSSVINTCVKTTKPNSCWSLRLLITGIIRLLFETGSEPFSRKHSCHINKESNQERSARYKLD